MSYWTFSLAKRRQLKAYDAPEWYPKTTPGNLMVLLLATAVTASTQGYDVAMMGGMNIVPQYTNYFNLSQATNSLMNAAVYVGGIMACFVWGWVSDAYGRRFGLYWAAMITLLAAALQASSRHIAMFCAARVIIGFGTTASAITGPAYLAETLPWNLRAYGLALFDAIYYVGAMTAAGVTYGCFQMESTWAWRLPSLLQGVWAISCLVLLPFMPESPRWLLDQGRGEDALLVLARVNANGDARDDLVRLQYCEICDTIRYEREPLTWRQMLGSYGARKRLMISASCACFSMLLGSIYTGYQIGQLLTHAGVADPTTQLKVNVGLHATNFVVSVIGSYFADRYGIKFSALVGTGLMSIFLFIVGMLTREFGQADSKTGVYATVTMIFLFSASFAFGSIPVLFLVPAELLNFSIRSYGMSMFSMIICITGIWSNFAFPAALKALGWKLFVINSGWDLIFLALIAYMWVEVRGKTLEEIDALFDGRKHSNAPNLEDVLRGVADEGWKEKLAEWMRQHTSMLNK